MIVLETPRLRLRPFEAEDLDPLAALLGDPRTLIHYPRPLSREEARAWLERNRQRWFHEGGFGLLALVLKDDDSFAGDCGVTVQRVEGRPEHEIGYHLRRDLWGRGLATEAARAVRDHAFRALGVTRLTALVRPENVPSRRVAERLGMRVERDVVHAELPHLLYVTSRDA